MPRLTSARGLAGLFLVACLAACSGIPILSIPKLIALKGKLLDANPDEFMVAIQADARLAPPPGSSPVLDIDIKPTRKWIVYAFTPESAAELRRIQKTFRDLKGKTKGATVKLGISQDSIAARNAGLANTKWESWLQASHADGFFELWSGTLGDLLAHGEPR